eukprot:scaffold7689_cov72-Skeletonema_dohrnii-CCMP3373.AAC.3
MGLVTMLWVCDMIICRGSNLLMDRRILPETFLRPPPMRRAAILTHALSTTNTRAKNKPAKLCSEEGCTETAHKCVNLLP